MYPVPLVVTVNTAPLAKPSIVFIVIDTSLVGDVPPNSVPGRV